MFEVLSTSGDTHLGGEDFDYRVIDHFVSKFKNSYPDSRGGNERSLSKLKKAVEEAERSLSGGLSARIEVEGFDEAGRDLVETLTRAKFEELNADLFRRTLGPVEQVLRDAKLRKDQVDDIVFVFFSSFLSRWSFY